MQQNFVPDPFTRELVLDILDRDIKRMVFHGSSFHNGEALILLKNKLLIEKFMSALREAVGRDTKLGNRVDVLEIYYTRNTESLDLPLTLRFYAANELDCFGPAFQQALNDLGAYQAARARRKARMVMTSATSIEITVGQVGNTMTVTDPEYLQTLLSDLAQVNRHAFDYTQRSAVTCDVNITLASQTSTKLSLAVTKQLNETPPFQGLFLEYYTTLYNNISDFT